MTEDKAQEILEEIYPPGSAKVWEAGKFFMMAFDYTKAVLAAEVAKREELEKAGRDVSKFMYLISDSHPEEAKKFLEVFR